jgi:release factor glutamine methyltransferase
MKNDALDLIRWAEERLRWSDIPCARHEAEVLFMGSFGMHREDIYRIEDFQPPVHHLETFKHHVRLRTFRYPLQYICKNTEFMGLLFELEEGVFIPRPETELLVMKTLEYINKIKNEKVTNFGKNKLLKNISHPSCTSNRINILEIGTGCGNIAISLTKNATECKIIASDVSDLALQVAVKNAQLHGVRKDITFIKSSFFENLSANYYGYFDIIVSNPPYIRREDIKHLQQEVSYEDILALDGGEDGLYFYRRILSEGVRYLEEHGIFAFEIGYDQAEELKNIIYSNSRRFTEPVFYKDYSGYNRVVMVGVKHYNRI